MDNNKIFTLFETQYILSADLSWRDVHGELVAIDKNTGEYHIFNAVGKLLWEHIVENYSVAEILQKIIRRYDVGSDRAESDFKKFVEDLKSRKLIVKHI